MAGLARLRIKVGTALTAGTIAVVLLTAGLIHGPWFVTSRQSVEDMARQINAQILARLTGDIGAIQAGAQAARAALDTNLREQVIDINQELKREFLFLSFLRSQPALATVAFGWPNGNLFTVSRPDSTHLRMAEIVWDPEAATARRRVDTYEVQADGSLYFLDRAVEDSLGFAQAEPWFDHPDGSWREVARTAADSGPGVVTASKVQVHGRDIGVLALGLGLDRVSSLLDGISVGQTGAVFVANPDSRIVAAQAAEPTMIQDPDGSWRHKILSEAVTPLFRIAAGAFLEAELPIRLIDEPTQLTYVEPETGDTYFVAAAPIPGINWTVVAVVPRSDFTAAIDRQTRWLLAAILGLVIAVAGLAAWLARRGLARPLAGVIANLRQLEALDLEAIRPVPSRLAEMDQLSAAVGQMATSLASFRKYIPTELVRTLFSQGIEAAPGGDHRRLTILFMDLAGFTSLAESLDDRLIPFLGDYLSAMAEVIHRHNGTIDKFIGDAVMAFWGAPIARDDHAIEACRAALDCQREAMRLTRANAAAGLPAVQVRIGINTGRVLVGNVGSRDRLNYTVIGDAVNLASRLEALNKAYGTEILLGEETWRETRAHLLARRLDRVAVYGKAQGGDVVELLGLAKDTDSRGHWPWIDAYEDGLDRFRRRDWAGAEAAFAQAIESRGGRDAPSSLMITRCRAFAEAPPPPDWDGLAVAESK